MTSRPSLWRSASFLVLLLVSVVSLVLGAWITLSKITTMLSGLTGNSATASDVYGGQSWIVFGAALTAAGLVGLFTTLGLSALRSILPRDAATTTDTAAEITTDSVAPAEDPETLSSLVNDPAERPAASAS